MPRENIVKTGNGNHIGIVIELCIATTLLCYMSFTIVWHSQYNLYYSAKWEIPRNINYLQVGKSDIKHHTLHMWNIKKMLIIEYWTLTLFIYQNWEISFGLVTPSSNAKQSCTAKFPYFRIPRTDTVLKILRALHLLSILTLIAFLNLLPSCI